MADPQPTLNDLAAKITELSGTLSAYLKQNSIPTPTFSADSPTSYKDLSPEIFMTKQFLLDSLTDMIYLVQGPSESIFNYAHNARLSLRGRLLALYPYSPSSSSYPVLPGSNILYQAIPDAAALNILNHFSFWTAVPLSGSATFAEIATHTALPVDTVTRLLTHAFTLRLFALETAPGSSTSRVVHTSRSAALARSPGLRALVATILDDAGAPVMVLHEALERASRSQGQGQGVETAMVNGGGDGIVKSAYALLQNGELAKGYKTSWEMLEKDGEGEKKGWRQRNFVEFMAYIKEIFGLEGVVLEACDWAGAGKAKVVDIGGSAGHDAIVLAQKFPELSITVEDLPECGSVFETTVPMELKSRVSFKEHDFFDPQPLHDADIYVLKMILHDWPDVEAIKILRAQIPALKPGARVILFEYVGSQSDAQEAAKLPRSIRQFGSSSDLRLMALFNTKERAVETWKDLFHEADPRFEVTKVKANPATFFAVIEAVWKGTEIGGD